MNRSRYFMLLDGHGMQMVEIAGPVSASPFVDGFLDVTVLEITSDARAVWSLPKSKIAIVVEIDPRHRRPDPRRKHADLGDAVLRRAVRLRRAAVAVGDRAMVLGATL